MEKDYLEMAMFVLDRFRTQKGKEWVNETLPQIEQEILFSSRRKRSIEYYKNPFLKGLEYIEVLLEAIIEKTPLKIHYTPFNKCQQVREISPYYLKEYNNRWYVIGHHPDKPDPIVSALDRIDSFEKLARKHFINNPFDLEDYFDDIIGVTRKLQDKCVKVELLFTAHRSGYVKTKPLHGSQKHKENADGSLTVTLHLIPNKEMYSQLLFFGEDVKVISPKKIANELCRILQSAADQY